MSAGGDGKNGIGMSIYTGVPTIEDEGDRHEKPWQRVPNTLLVLLLGVYLLLGYLTQLVEDSMPTVINDVDVARDISDTFSEEAAWRYLNITLGTEPRVAGTRYHLQKTRDLKALVDTVTSQGQLPVKTDWQTADGDYWIGFALPHVNAYQNASNVIALLEGESGFHTNGTIGTTLLVNCHYDSVPFAMGASDNAIFCAVMMETLSRLARRTRRFKHNIVFLFNGAEENPLQGSHAFLKHEWSKGITNVVNLDAAGMNGKPIVFQVTDPRVLNAYKRVTKYPSGQSIGEFLFLTGIIPSDTDFRIWRDFGKFHGVDIAFVKWGHVYHTRYDHPDLVRTGVLQNAGDMLLNLVAELADMEELDTQIEPSAAVYYDYLYWFMVTYSYAAAVAVDVLAAIYACVSVAYYVWLVGLRGSTVQELMMSVAGRVASMVAGVLVTTILVAISVATTKQLRYMSEPWIVVPLYWLPYVITAVCTSQAFDAWRTKRSGLNRSIRSLQAQSATRLSLAVLLLALTCVPSLTTLRYMITVPLFIMTTLSLISLTVVRYVRLAAWQQLLMEVIFSIPSSMFLISLTLRFDAIMLPTMGRTSTDTPDYIIAVINCGLAIIVSATVSGIELLFSRKRLWMMVTPVALVCIIIMFIPISPYQDEGPSTQRHYWFHSEVITYNFNNEVTSRYSGVLVTKHDAYTQDYVLPSLNDRGIWLNSRTDFTDDCERYVYCNLPLYRVRFSEYLKHSLFLSTGPPAAFNPEPELRVATRTCIGEACTFIFYMTGPAHNLITIWPRENVNVTGWSFSHAAQQTFKLHNRPVYAIVHSTATFSENFAPFIFTINFTIPLSQQSLPVLDVSYHAHKIHHPEDFTQEYRNLIDAVPKYFNIASFMSFRKNYVF